MANEPQNWAEYDQMYWYPDPYIRVFKALRRAMDEAGFQDIRLAAPEDGRAVDVGHFLGGDGFPLLQDDLEVDQALGVLAAHTYDWGTINASIIQDAWVDGALASGKEMWQTEFSHYVGGTQMEILMHAARRFIADMAFLQFNGWFWWTGWGGGPIDGGESLIDGNGVDEVNKGKVYYFLQKIFTTATAGSVVRRVTTDEPGLISDDDVLMDMVAFVNQDHMLVCLVNPTDTEKTTNLNGLSGARAEVFLLNGSIDMELVNTLDVRDGTIPDLVLDAMSVTLLKTDAGITAMERPAIFRHDRSFSHSPGPLRTLMIKGYQEKGKGFEIRDISGGIVYGAAPGVYIELTPVSSCTKFSGE
jgi:hypothetical protein